VTWASNSFSGVGILKGPGQGQPLMTKAEAMFLIAEAQMRGFIGTVNVATSFAGTIAVNDKAAFDLGIIESMEYLYKNENNVVTKAAVTLVKTGNTVTDTTGMFIDYLAANEGNYLVHYEEATTPQEKLEAIITQKWIAVNMINSDEGYNEYRRTGFPATVPGGDAEFDIASNKSNATARPDRLPTRVLYPSSEQSYNATNYRAVNHVGDLIFWDPN